MRIRHFETTIYCVSFYFKHNIYFKNCKEALDMAPFSLYYMYAHCNYDAQHIVFIFTNMIANCRNKSVKGRFQHNDN